MQEYYIMPVTNQLRRCRDVICTPIQPGVWRYMYRCVGVRQTAGGACELTGGTEHRKMVHFNRAMVKLFK